MKSRGYILLVAMAMMSLRAVAQYEPRVSGERVAHTHYTLDYNEEHEQPNWVYYTLTPKDLVAAAERSNSFRADPKVSTASAAVKDYVKSGYDRGHLAPAADMSRSEVSMRESFYMSNMSPQHPSCNRGVWKRCEEHVRRLAVDSLYIVTGAVFRDNKGTIGANKVTVPGAYYKVVYLPAAKRMEAYVIPNEGSDKGLEAFRVTVDEVEEMIGIDLFEQLPDDVEMRLESIK